MAMATLVAPWRRPLQPWKEAALLWCGGFRDACCLHHAIFFCKRSRCILIKTGQCFLLNGFIFVGSIVILESFVVPVLDWLLNFHSEASTEFGHSKPMHGRGAEGFLGVLQIVLVYICYVFWFYPLYVISFVINYIWYNEIAQQAFEVIKEGQNKCDLQPQKQVSMSTRNNDKPEDEGISNIILKVGEQIYSVIMLSIFFAEIFMVSLIPYVGRILEFFLLSWLYAYYCFEYKWSFAKWNLERRLCFFENNWAYFAGFGFPYVLTTQFFNPFIRCGVVAILFPLFVLVATASCPDVISTYLGNRERALKRVPIFYVANIMTTPMLRLLQRGLMAMFTCKNKDL